MSATIDPLAPDVVSLAQAARLLPSLRGGRPVHPSTLWRWASSGVAGVRLPIIRVGGTACTSRQALRQFLADVEAARRPAPPEPLAPTQPTAAERAGEELTALGIGSPRAEGRHAR
jgi:hypothetical protein